MERKKTSWSEESKELAKTVNYCVVVVGILVEIWDYAKENEKKQIIEIPI